MKHAACTISIVVFTAAGCGGGGANEQTTPGGADAAPTQGDERPVPARGGRPYPEDFRREYIAECQDERGSRADCECILEEIEAVVPFEEYSRYVDEEGSPEPTGVGEAIEECTT